MESSIIRPNLIDYAKVLTMFFVVFGHYVPYLGLEMGDNNLWHLVHVINVFHMPLFFFVSGLLFSKKELHSFFESLKKTLILPYLYISVICFFVGWIIFTIVGEFSLKAIIKDIIGIVSGGDFYGYGRISFSGPLWFCYSLITIKLIAQFTVNSSKPVIVWGVILFAIFIMYAGDCLPLRIDSSLVGFLFFITGFYLKKLHTFFVETKYSEFPLMLIGIVLMYIDIYLNVDFSAQQVVSINVLYFGKSPLWFYLGAMGGIFVIFSISKVLANFKNSIVLACSNGMIIILGFQHLTYKLFSLFIIPTYAYTYAIGTSILIYIICYFIILLSSHYFPILLGNRKLV